MDALDFYQQLTQCIQAQIPYVLVTLVGVKGSAPQDVGAKMLVTSDGLLCGTVGGGKVEATSIRHAQQMIQDRQEHDLCVWNLQRDIHMTCGGEVQLFFEGHMVSPWTICIFGAGHVAQSLIPLLIQLDALVLCIDSRMEWIERLPTARNLRSLCISDPTEAISHVPEGAFVAMMTKGHSSDVPLLIALAESKKSSSFLGMIGSDVKGLRVRTELKSAGVSEDFIAELRTPIGLPIGTNHPVEIAVSITAQMIQVRDQLRM